MMFTFVSVFFIQTENSLIFIQWSVSDACMFNVYQADNSKSTQKSRWFIMFYLQDLLAKYSLKILTDISVY